MISDYCAWFCCLFLLAVAGCCCSCCCTCYCWCANVDIHRQGTSRYFAIVMQKQTLVTVIVVVAVMVDERVTC